MFSVRIFQKLQAEPCCIHLLQKPSGKREKLPFLSRKFSWASRERAKGGSCQQAICRNQFTKEAEGNWPMLACYTFSCSDGAVEITGPTWSWGAQGREGNLRPSRCCWSLNPHQSQLAWPVVGDDGRPGISGGPHIPPILT